MTEPVTVKAQSIGSDDPSFLKFRRVEVNNYRLIVKNEDNEVLFSIDEQGRKFAKTKRDAMGAAHSLWWHLQRAKAELAALRHDFEQLFARETQALTELAEARNEVLALTTENERLREALGPFAEMAKHLDKTEKRRDGIYCGGSPGLLCEIKQSDYHTARAALNGNGEANASTSEAGEG